MVNFFESKYTEFNKLSTYKFFCFQEVVSLSNEEKTFNEKTYDYNSNLPVLSSTSAVRIVSGIGYSCSNGYLAVSETAKTVFLIHFFFPSSISVFNPE